MASSLPRDGRMVEEDRRIGRVLQLIELIARRPRRHLRRDLAEIFPVSERMIQRDLVLIRHALKLPLCHSTEGYYFEELPRLPATHFSFHFDSEDQCRPCRSSSQLLFLDAGSIKAVSEWIIPVAGDSLILSFPRSSACFLA